MKKVVELLIQLAEHKHDGLGRLFLDPVDDPARCEELRAYLGPRVSIKAAHLEGQRLHVRAELPDYKTESDNLVRLARELFSRARPHAACDQLNEALALFPLNGVALKQMGRHRYGSGDYASAASLFVRANEILREDGEALHALAEISLHQGREPSAVAYFERAVTANPDDETARAALAALKSRIAGRFDRTSSS